MEAIELTTDLFKRWEDWDQIIVTGTLMMAKRLAMVSILEANSTPSHQTRT